MPEKALDEVAEAVKRFYYFLYPEPPKNDKSAIELNDNLFWYAH